MKSIRFAVAGIAIIVVSITSCDQSNVESYDSNANVQALTAELALSASRIIKERHNECLNNSGLDTECIMNAINGDRPIMELAKEISPLYPGLGPDNADVALESVRHILSSSQHIYAQSSDGCDLEYSLCLTSVTALGAIMMAGCSALTVGAVLCGAAVLTWVAAESGQCYVAHTSCLSVACNKPQIANSTEVT